MKLFKLVIVVLAFASCNNNDTEINRLTEENNRLRAILTDIQSKDNYIYEAKVATESNKILLGETYNADVMISVANKEKPPKVLFCRVENGRLKPTGDTLPFNKETMTSYYHIIPKDTGSKEWGGIVLTEINGQIKEFPFIMSYTVNK
jgi:hypothetical protein